MIREDYPLTEKFCALYWHQMGPSIYGCIDKAFKAMLSDASRTGEASFARELSKELVALGETFDDKSEVDASGRFLDFGNAHLFRDDIEHLAKIVQADLIARDS